MWVVGCVQRPNKVTLFSRHCACWLTPVCASGVCVPMCCMQVELHWQPGGPQDKVLVSHMSMPGSSKGTWQQQTAYTQRTQAAKPVGA